MATTTDITVRAIGHGLAADIEGVDLRRLDDADFAVIAKAWIAHPVLRFRGQTLTDPQLMDFSRRFGELDRVPIRAADVLPNNDPLVAVAPEAQEWVNIISNVKVDGKAVGGLGSYELYWHSDMSYNDLPPKASVLYGLEVPPSGGDTWFADMYAAYESLPGSLKQRLDGLICIHDASRNSAGELRVGYDDVTDPSKTVGARHRIVVTHPDSGRKCLYLGRRRNAYVMGLAVAESEALLDELWDYAVRPAVCWAQSWRKGDAVMWDNRCVLHRRDAFDDSQSRVMHRTQICGVAPQ